MAAVQSQPARWPRIHLSLILVVTPLIIFLEGQPAWCHCGRPYLWITSGWSPHTSQHVFDPYSFTHFLHGLLLYFALAACWPSLSVPWRLTITALLEALWEILENSPAVVARFRAQTAAAEYSGDSIANTLGDLAACLAGFWIAQRIGWRWSAVIFVLVEVALLLTIRDSLLLTVVMLIYPSESLRQWQAAQ
jgi:hypothetical protein